MARDALKEVKGIRNINFYPEHYFTEALAEDAKTGGYTGKALKAKRKELQALLENYTDSKATEDLEELQDAIFSVLGFYEKAGESSATGLFHAHSKEFTIQIEKKFPLHGEGELWLLKASKLGQESRNTPDEIEEGPSEDTTADHFHQLHTVVEHKGQRVRQSWKSIIDGIFDSDFSAAEWLIINLGDRFVLLERGRWQEGNEGYLEVSLAEMLAIHSDATYQIIESHFSARPFPIDSAESFHDTIAQNAHKKATQVTKGLRDTVRESIEILANEVLAAHRESPLKALKNYDLSRDDGRNKAAKAIFEESLRYVYRMLFLLFAESQPASKGALPVHSRPYQMGYSLEKLRNLEAVPFLDRTGNFIQRTLELACRIYFGGYRTESVRHRNEQTKRDEVKTDALGFSFPALGTDLFRLEKTPIFTEVTLCDGPMQQVLSKLSLASVGTGRASRTCRVHYAGLGLNQLGAVYEGLLSLKPEILSQKAILLKKGKKDPAHKYIPWKDKDSIDEDMLAKDEDGSDLVRESGQFLLTPLGLERKFSASFYTPEVLTRFLAKEAVDSLLGASESIPEDPKERRKQLTRMENLKICEPAMGSGAFVNAVIDEIALRMAKRYRKDDEELRNKYIKKQEVQEKPFVPENAPVVHEFAHYIAKAKEHLMNRCVYGVDLNATAVELAKVSLWLNCLHEDGSLPFLDLKIRHGNSLVGCWVKRHFIEGTKVSHFLLPSREALDPHLDGLVLGERDLPFIEDQSLLDRLKSLKTEWSAALDDQGVRDRVEALNERVNQLYEKHLQMKLQKKAELEQATTSEEKNDIFDRFKKDDVYFNQLRSMMDYWCSLWFWPPLHLDKLPSLESYLRAMEWMAETPLAYGGSGRTEQLVQSGFEELLVSREVSLENNFFHWDLEFAEVFADGGFDLVLGNPPWAPVRWEDADFFEMASPGIHATKRDSQGKLKAYLACLRKQGSLQSRYVEAKAKADGFANFLKSSSTYPFVDRSQVNTYRYFYQRFYSLVCKNGIHAMISQDGILTDKGCVEMRPVFIRELQHIYRFVNELKLFEDIGNLTFYMVSISQKNKSTLDFELIDNLYHPETVARCRNESALAPYRGMKGGDGKFELRGHPKRIVRLTEESLSRLAEFDSDSDANNLKLPIIHGQIELEVLCKLAAHSRQIGNLQWLFHPGFHEGQAPRNGLIARRPGSPDSLEKAVMTGPNVFVANPANKIPNPGCRNHRDFSKVELSTVNDDYFPDTVYQCTPKGLKSKEYNSRTPWGSVHSREYRVIARRMVSTTGARTLSSAIIPPGPSHIDASSSLSFAEKDCLTITSGLFNSLIFDFLTRSISGGTIGQAIFEMFPSLDEQQLNSPLVSSLSVRALRLSSISIHYASLWELSFKKEFKSLEISSAYTPSLPYAKLSKKWKRDTCIRDWRQREQALCEIDAIVATLFGFDKDVLLNLYRSQFGVLQKVFQDLPDQKRIKEDEHFPRYRQMSEAYDQVKKYLEAVGVEKNKSRKAS